MGRNSNKHKANPGGAAPTSPGGRPPPPPAPDSLELRKKELEIQKLEHEIAAVQSASRWWNKSIREVKVSEWLTALAAIAAFVVAGWTGWFNAVREKLSAQADRLAIETENLAKEKSAISADVTKARSELDQAKDQLRQYQEEQNAIVELRGLESKGIKVSYEIPRDFNGIMVSFSASGNQRLVLSGPFRIEEIGKAISAAKNFRSLLGVSIYELRLRPDEIAPVLQHGGLQKATFRLCGLDNESFASIVTRNSLKDLRLSQNGISSIAKFPVMESVTSLQLDNNPITDDGLSQVASRFPNLERLELRDTEVTDGLAQSVGQLRRLTLLGLQGTKVTAKGLIALERCPVLDCIWIEDETFTNEVEQYYKKRNRVMHHMTDPIYAP